MWEVSTVSIYPGLENGWIGYEQLAGSRYASTKRAELELLSCMRGYHVYKDRQGVHSCLLVAHVHVVALKHTRSDMYVYRSYVCTLARLCGSGSMLPKQLCISRFIHTHCFFGNKRIVDSSLETH